MMLISPEYKEQQIEMHENPNYGVASVQYAPLVTKLINSLQVKEVLDYGCGKGRLGENIKPEGVLKLYQYDPGVDGIDDPPDPAEMVCCIDVLEHIEPELLDNVLDVLPDGRNAHLIQADYKFWLPKLWDRFQVFSMSHEPGGFYVIVRANGVQ